jgi:hypothetical protein
VTFSFSISSIHPQLQQVAIMGGKTWSEQEEEYFWEVIVPSSPKAAKKHDRDYSWAQCACMMQQAMGKNARRKYTTLMLCTCYLVMASFCANGPS